MVGHEASRFPHKELLHVPGSSTTRDRLSTRIYAFKRIAFRQANIVGTPDYKSIAAQWLACASPYRRFTSALAGLGSMWLAEPSSLGTLTFTPYRPPGAL